MEPIQQLIGNNCIEDVRWLSSLSDSELDLLISLKMLVLRRAKVIGHQELAKNFHLKILRALALVLMEHAKDNIKTSPHVPELAKSDGFMDGCGLLLGSKLADVLSIEELKSRVGVDRKKQSKRPPQGKKD
ncbi:Spc97 / Spc98 family of spindle pole body (SBP) component [Euphorbia peplus]|nr:Spc97 / Spc98 family of spindle pole body (SBP) component [Euphorbia peplus]